MGKDTKQVRKVNSDHENAKAKGTCGATHVYYNSILEGDVRLLGGLELTYSTV